MPTIKGLPTLQDIMPRHQFLAHRTTLIAQCLKFVSPDYHLSTDFYSRHPEVVQELREAVSRATIVADLILEGELPS